MNYKRRGRKGLLHNMMYHTGMCLEGMREMTKDPIRIDGIMPEHELKTF
jgi:hypothetical protein